MENAAAQRSAARRDLMLNTPIGRLILRMAVPTMISMLITSMYQLGDVFFINMYIKDSAATAAVGVNSVLDNIIMMMGSFLAVGANSYIARLLGAKENDKAERVLSTVFYTALMTGILALVLGLAFMEPMLSLFGAKDPDIMGYSKSYASYILYAAPFMTTSFILNQCLRSEGSATYSMIGMVLGAIINLGLDPLFMGVFKMGMDGAAAATAIGKTVSFIALLVPYLKRKCLLRIKLKKITYSRDIVSEIFKMGNPSLFRMALASLAAAIMNNLATGYDDPAVLAAITVVNRIIMIITSALLGFGQGFQPVAGYNWGSKRYDRVKSGFRFASIAGAGGVIVISLVAGIFAERILAPFSDGGHEMLRIATLCLRLQCVASPIHAWCIVVTMAYAGTGKGLGSTLLSLCRQGLFFIPTVFLMNEYLGVNGLAASQAVADALSLLLALPLAVRFVKELNRLIGSGSAEDIPLPAQNSGLKD